MFGAKFCDGVDRQNSAALTGRFVAKQNVESASVENVDEFGRNDVGVFFGQSVGLAAC